MEKISEQSSMREIEIFGIPALFTEEEISAEQVLGMHCYELFSAADGTTFLGTVLTVIPVEVPESGERDVFDSDLMLDTEGVTLTPQEFVEKYLSPVSGPDLEERYGKED